MTQRSMILSAFLAALVLVVIGGVVANLTEPAPVELAQAGPSVGQAEAETAPAAEPEGTAAAEAPAQDRAAYAEREAQYRRLIEEANRRLTEQQQALEDARRRVEAAEAGSATLEPAVAHFDDDDEGHERDDDGEGYEDDDDDEHEHERGERWERDDD